MEKSFNFKLNTSSPLSKSALDLGLLDFQSVLNYVNQLPYGRNTDRCDYTLVLKEQKGTCSTKHAFLKQLAIENLQGNITLCLGIYKMNGLNTKGIASVLKHYNLDYIPEAHCYLKIDNKIIDITRSITSEHSFENSILTEETILPFQIGDYKVKIHQTFIKNWIVSEKTKYTFEDLWAIREACIKALNQ
ncbi:hypothetical protein [Olleya sp. R77988]|uniref:hypothetical protein n=1 Tax=Olleya sp. R77988 TaxID=3093875 RepID=UPI0037C9AA65